MRWQTLKTRMQKSCFTEWSWWGVQGRGHLCACTLPIVRSIRTPPIQSIVAKLPVCQRVGGGDGSPLAAFHSRSLHSWAMRLVRWGFPLLRQACARASACVPCRARSQRVDMHEAREAPGPPHASSARHTHSSSALHTRACTCHTCTAAPLAIDGHDGQSKRSEAAAEHGSARACPVVVLPSCVPLTRAA